MVSTDMTLHVELSGLDRDLLERTCENLEWYRKHLQEHKSEAELWRDPQVKAATLEWYHSHLQADKIQAEQGKHET